LRSLLGEYVTGTPRGTGGKGTRVSGEPAVRLPDVKRRRPASRRSTTASPTKQNSAKAPRVSNSATTSRPSSRITGYINGERAAPGPPRRSNGSALLVAPAQTIEKVLDRHFERQRKLIKRASRYAIGGRFVLLQLLERNPDRVRKLCLRHARFQPPPPQPRTNVAINGVRKTVRH
jgi:hypothetical protein